MIDIGDILVFAGLGLLGYGAWTLAGWAALGVAAGLVLVAAGVARQIPKGRKPWVS